MTRINLIEKYNELKRPLILDGAVGSNLQHLCESKLNPVWTSKLNIEKPETVIDLHSEYIKAGVDIITTNTFRTNPSAFKLGNINCSNEEFIKAGVDLAITARSEKNVILAGSNAPAEDCYQVERTLTNADLGYNHKFHIDTLWNYGCDVIWNETFSHLDEIELVCNHCSINNIPFTLNLFFDEELNILSGECIFDVIEIVKPFKPIAIGFNCITPLLMEKLFKKFHPNFNWGIYLNCDSGKLTDTEIKCSINSDEYFQIAKNYLEYSPMFIGSCCGSNPSHTKLLKEKLSEIYRN